MGVRPVLAAVSSTEALVAFSTRLLAKLCTPRSVRVPAAYGRPPAAPEELARLKVTLVRSMMVAESAGHE